MDYNMLSLGVACADKEGFELCYEVARDDFFESISGDDIITESVPQLKITEKEKQNMAEIKAAFKKHKKQILFIIAAIGTFATAVAFIRHRQKNAADAEQAKMNAKRVKEMEELAQWITDLKEDAHALYQEYQEDEKRLNRKMDSAETKKKLDELYRKSDTLHSRFGALSLKVNNQVPADIRKKFNMPRANDVPLVDDKIKPIISHEKRREERDRIRQRRR